jgi:hypothetical protein
MDKKNKTASFARDINEKTGARPADSVGVAIAYLACGQLRLLIVRVSANVIL